mgnify:CR=1 FL=1
MMAKKTRPTALCALAAFILLVTGLEPSRLELEVTEASLISDKRRAEEVMASVKAAGVRIAMDDYGTGYASLSTLQTFPFDKIKIDQSFIKPLGRDRQAAAIVRSTLILGEALGIPVLAEGVETETQLAFLDRARCREAQGYLFGKPSGAAETAERIREQWARKRAEFNAPPSPSVAANPPPPPARGVSGTGGSFASVTVTSTLMVSASVIVSNFQTRTCARNVVSR